MLGCFLRSNLNRDHSSIYTHSSICIHSNLNIKILLNLSNKCLWLLLLLSSQNPNPKKLQNNRNRFFRSRYKFRCSSQE